ncbi:uncharacterized protein BXZ73DRAFT_89669 [Epithele typhae]|uniref:uncharacterized protein n=1 Tax=Epithele typhae TaxID=378194 RepID=UPI002007E356|nr:uncharacterized protein BXZ73DRAFT_89669 [Epithele typhae]KAH9934008.1 hypothetical protein BXZ73DRAFT_89669 [Epithele typhae]
MSEKHKKRKQRPYETFEPPQPSQPDTSLFIQAHEADLVHGPNAASAARSLEVSFVETAGRRKLVPGEGLIKWASQLAASFQDFSKDEHLHLGSGGARARETASEDDDGVWVDRYDARLLLESLPEPPLPPSAPVAEPPSPGGWSDLPSDAEDTFFFSTREVADYRRDKRRRVLDDNREARLHALRDADGSDDDDPKDPKDDWGGSDEEPDSPQRELMRRTAAHVLGSPNPAQLQMRILANHGADPRFAFLRGRWARAWRLELARQKQTRAQTQAEERAAGGGGAGIGGLAGYGDSDEEEGEDEGEAGRGECGDMEVDGAADATDGGGRDEGGVQSPPLPREPPPAPPTEQDEEALKAARRAKAKEWAEKRRAEKENEAKQT